MPTLKEMPDLSFSFGGLKLGIDLYDAAMKRQDLNSLWIVQAFDNNVPTNKIFEGFLIQVNHNRGVMEELFGKELVGRIEEYQQEKK